MSAEEILNRHLKNHGFPLNVHHAMSAIYGAMEECAKQKALEAFNEFWEEDKLNGRN